MPKVAGIIKAKSVKERTTSWGKKLATSFNIEDVWYSGGFKNYDSVNKGDEVEIEFETNAKGFHNINSISVTKAGATRTPAKVGGVGGGGGRDRKSVV